MKKTEKDWELRFPWAIKSLQSVQYDRIKNVFDIGSAEGILKKQVLELGLNYQAFDLVTKGDVEKWNIETEFPYNAVADAIIFLEVVEHLNNPWLGMKNIAKVIRPDGYLIMSTPNPAWSDSRVSLFRKGVLTMFTKTDLDENHHVFTPWKHIIFKLLNDNGFEIIRCEPIGNKTSITAYPFWSWKLPFRFFYRLVKLIIEKKDRDAVGVLYGIVAQRKM